MRRVTRVSPVTAFTLLITSVWASSMVVRLFSPVLAANFAAVDAGMLLVLGYWFSANSLRRLRNGST